MLKAKLAHINKHKCGNYFEAFAEEGTPVSIYLEYICIQMCILKSIFFARKQNYIRVKHSKSKKCYIFIKCCRIVAIVYWRLILIPFQAINIIETCFREIFYTISMLIYVFSYSHLFDLVI